MDSSDPYVIGEYRIGWTAVDAQQMDYACDCDSNNCTSPNACDSACSFGGCDCEGLSSTGTRVTVTAPGVAHHDFLAGYDETNDWACWTWFCDFTPFYINARDEVVEPAIYVLRCFEDTDCPTGQRCNKSGSWQQWACMSRPEPGDPCTSDAECSSGFCDNDGVGLSDDGWCFIPSNVHFDGQEPAHCEVSTGTGSALCDERQVGEALGQCLGISYRAEKCSSNCEPADITDVFECDDSGCACAQPMCDGLSSGSKIPTCAGGQTYIADLCSQTASGIDRFESVCRSSAFAADCTGDPECNDVVAGTGNCSLACQPVCPNGFCEPELGENKCTCPQDCGAPPPTETSCFDGTDNDCDGLVDGSDPDCIDCPNGFCEPELGEDKCTCALDCGAPPATEGPGMACSDGIDNDCDTFVDCDDADCDCEAPCQLYDMNGDGHPSIGGDVEAFVRVVYFDEFDWYEQQFPDRDPVCPGDCNCDGHLSIGGDVECFVDCVYFQMCGGCGRGAAAPDRIGKASDTERFLVGGAIYADSENRLLSGIADVRVELVGLDGTVASYVTTTVGPTGAWAIQNVQGGSYKIVLNSTVGSVGDRKEVCEITVNAESRSVNESISLRLSLHPMK